MKCLSLLQPFASLIALGCKSIETRSKDFTGGYRGVIGIHASGGRDYLELCYREPFDSALKRGEGRGIGYNFLTGWRLPLGCIVAVGDLAHVFKIEFANLTRPFVEGWLEEHGRSPRDADTELAFGDYTPGRYMYLLKGVYALPTPIPARGSPGLWNFDMEDPRK